MAFGFWEAVLSFLTRQIGLRTDAADPAGSLHAKVADIDNDIAIVDSHVYRWATKTPGIVFINNYDIGECGTLTVLNIAGAGYLTGIAIQAEGYEQIKITVNGGTTYTTMMSQVPGSTAMPVLLRFSSSLLVQIYNSSGTSYANGHIAVFYLLD